MNKELLEKSIEIFDTQDKWKALFEISQDVIIGHWLTIGAKALRKSFENDPVWGCEKWGSERDTCWHLKDKEYGRESLRIGLGYPTVELHLHLNNSQSYSYGRAKELIKSKEFKPLLELFELNTPPKKYAIIDGGLAYNAILNPFSGNTDTEVRRRELAWIASHETDDYVKEMGGWIRRLTDDSVHTLCFGN
ncbi:MAG: hypothetical protein RL693_438 [Verrucomicrobiota bacterium]